MAAVEIDLPDAEATEELGRRIAGLLAAGDLVVLIGDLGAGKTTLTRGIGEGLGVRGPVTSPTFVISRHHPSARQGPDLVHVDAYRVSSGAEIDDLDLDIDNTVTVVEWGSGRVEHLAESRLEVRLDTVGSARRATVVGLGPRWAALDRGAIAWPS